MISTHSIFSGKTKKIKPNFIKIVGEKLAKALPVCFRKLSTLFFHKVCILKSLNVQV